MGRMQHTHLATQYHHAVQVAEELSRETPINLLRCSAPWSTGALLSLDPVVERLRELLPATFEELERDFAVGVVDAQGKHVLIDKGPLPEAVAASAAIPVVFEAVKIPGLQLWILTFITGSESPTRPPS